jgi:hypothetical protein
MPNPLTFSQTPEEQSAFWAQLREGEAQRASYMAQANANVADAVGNFHTRAPYADPGVTLSVGTGVANGQIDQESAAQAVDQSVAQGNRPAWSPVESAGLLDTVRQQALLRKPQSEIDAMQMASIEKKAAANMDPAIRDASGNLDATKTLAAAGVQAHAPTTDWTSPGDLLGEVGSGIKGGIRSALSVAQSGWEEVQNRGAQAAHTVGEGVSDLSSGDVSGALGAYGKTLAMANPFGVAEMAATGGESAGQALESTKATSLYQQMNQAHLTGSIDLGSGFFPAGTVTKVWQPAAARQVRGTIPGTNTAWTFGRQIASVLAQPGTKQYDIMSGFIDGAAQFAFDPSIALQDAAMVPRAATLFEPAAKALEGAPEAEKTLVGASHPFFASGSADDLKSLVNGLRGKDLSDADRAFVNSVAGTIKSGALPVNPDEFGSWISKSAGDLRDLGASGGSPHAEIAAMQDRGVAYAQLADLADKYSAPEKALVAAAGRTYTPMQLAMNSDEGKSVILDLKNAKSPEAVAGIIGSDLGLPTLQKIADTENWGKIRGILGAAARENPAWGEQFTQIGGDAAAHVADTAATESNVREAAKGVTIDAERPTINASNTDAFLDHSAQAGFINRLAETTDPIEVAKRLGPKAPPSLISAVTKTGDADGVKAALRGELGLSIASTDDLPGATFGYEFKRGVVRAIPGLDPTGGGILGREAARQFSRVPDQFFEGYLPNATDAMQRATLNSMDDYMKTNRVDYASRSKAYGIVADGFASGSAEGRYQALNGFTDVMRKALINQGVPEDAAGNWMNLFKDRFTSVYGADAMGRPSDFNYISTATGNADLSMASPALLSQEMGSLVQMPDPRELRRVTSNFGRLISNVEYDPVNGIQRAGNLKFPLSMVQKLGEDVFPRLAITRAATAIRVMMDEQLRLAAAGLPSAISHPIHWMALVAGSNTDLERLGLGTEDAQKMIDSVAGSVAGGGSSDAVLRSTRATGGMTDVAKGEKWIIGHTETARQFATDPIASRVLQGQTTDEIMNYLHSGEGAKDFDRYKELAANTRSVSATTGAVIPTPIDLADDQTLRTYIDTRIRGHVDALTKGNTEMRAALGGGILPDHYAALNGEQGAAPFAFDSGEATPGYRKMTEDWMNHPDSPERVQYNQRLTDYADPATVKDQWDKASRWMMGKLFNVPVRTLTRSPVFRSAFYERVAELADQLHPDEANKLLKSIEATAGEQGFTGKVADFLGGDKQLQSIIDGASNAHGNLNLEDVFDYAKGHAIDTVHDTLYDVSSKTNLEQSMRMIAPFAQAWRTILTDWTKILARNPGFVRRTQMAVQGARDAGFFYTDPVTGKEMFNYPMSDWVVKALTGGGVGSAIRAATTGTLSHVPIVGAPAAGAINSALGAIPGVGEAMSASGGVPGVDPLRGEVAGLNMVSSSFLPGLGPVAQIPLAHLLKNKPWADDIRGFLMPYGVPTDENSPMLGELGAYLLPSWSQKVISAISTSPDSTSSYGNTYSQMLQQLASSGKYGTSMDERRRLIADATSKAKLLTMLRGFGQFVDPASPSYAPEIKTQEGDQLMAALAQDAHQYQSEDYNTWVQRFMSTYGEGPFIAAQSKTRSQQGGLDASHAFGQWEADHAGEMNNYPAVAGYFGSIGSDFDQEVYNRQLATGERAKLSADDMLNASQATVAKWKYDQAKQALGAHPTPAQQEWLANVKAKLQDQYPGYAVEPSVSIADLPAKIQQLQRAAVDPGLKGDVQTATATYLALRDQALSVAKSRGSKGAGSLAGTNNADLRAWLAGAATKIIQKYPTFSRLFDSVLSSEVDS